VRLGLSDWILEKVSWADLPKGALDRDKGILNQHPVCFSASLIQVPLSLASNSKNHFKSGVDVIERAIFLPINKNTHSQANVCKYCFIRFSRFEKL
jgi:hypothetical protein